MGGLGGMCPVRVSVAAVSLAACSDSVSTNRGPNGRTRAESPLPHS
jgi:hypothetical protein